MVMHTDANIPGGNPTSACIGSWLSNNKTVMRRPSRGKLICFDRSPFCFVFPSNNNAADDRDTKIGVCGWILTILCWLLVLVTMPFSFGICFKVNLKAFPLCGCVFFYSITSRTQKNWCLRCCLSKTVTTRVFTFVNSN